METISIDKQYFDCCSLVSTEHIASSLGEPIELPSAIADVVEGDYSEEECEQNLLQLFGLMKGYKYELVVRDNTYNHETDLDQFFIYSVYAPVGNPDWVWQRDCFVAVEMGSAGYPRYTGYKSAKVYDLGDSMLGENGFFSWTLGWYGRYIVDGDVSNESDSLLEDVNEKISEGYGSNPTYELRELCYADPIWVEKLQGFVSRVRGSKYPMVFTPTEPCYN